MAGFRWSRWLRQLKRLRLHVHDYEMEFADETSFDYVFHCKCGDMCSSMAEAMIKMRRLHRLRIMPEEEDE